MSPHNTKYYNPVTNEVLPKQKWIEWAQTVYATDGHVHTDDYCWNQLHKIYKLEEVEVH